MEKIYGQINSVVTRIFNDILYIEEETLKRSTFDEVTMTELHVIEKIGLSGKRTMSEVAKQLHITVGTLTTCINNLVKKEFVVRSREERDRRLVYIGLTNKGKLLYRLHDKFHKNMVERLVQNFDDVEQKNLLKSLEQLSEFLFDYEKEVILKIEERK